MIAALKENGIFQRTLIRSQGGRKRGRPWEDWSPTGPEKFGFLLGTWEGGPDGYEDWQF